jgi:hypothetical protein
VLSPHGALQLLLIVNYLCSWAVDVYRDSILLSLAGSQENLRLLTPSLADTVSHLGEQNHLYTEESESWYLIAPKKPYLKTTATDFRDRSFWSEDLLRLSHSAQNFLGPSLGQENYTHWLRWTAAKPGLPQWIEKATIRHANLVQFSRQELLLPEDNQMLRKCLKLCFPHVKVEEAAIRLHRTIQEDSLEIDATAGTVLKLNFQRLNSMTSIRALIYCRSQLNPESWQLTRQLIRIVCSVVAMRELAQISGIAHIQVAEGGGNIRMQECFYQAYDSFKFVNGHDSARLALARRHLRLMIVSDDSGTSNFEWVDFDQSDGKLTLDELSQIMSNAAKMSELSNFYMADHPTLYRVPLSTEAQVTSTNLPETPRSRSRQGILIKKPHSWPLTTQTFCLLVLDDGINFEDTTRLGRLVREAKMAGDISGGSHHLSKGCQVDQSDAYFLDRWIHILEGRLPETTIGVSAVAHIATNTF